MPAAIGTLTEGRGALCEELLRALPDWFGIEEAVRRYAEEVERMECLAAYEDGEAAGFLALKRHGQYASEIHVMAVRPGLHRRGIGRLLVEAAESSLRRRGTEFLTVKTLSPARESPEYARTRAFYEALGFRPVEEFPDLWGPANPAVLYVKRL